MRLVHGLAARVEREPADVDPPCAAADPVAGLEDDDVLPRARQPVGGRQAREPRPDDGGGYQMPPSVTVIASPLTPLASSPARNAITAATSSAVTTRPAG